MAEGNEHLREAEKCLKTGFLKWKPDYEGAGIEYGKAAISFKNAKAYDQAIASYTKQADVLKQTGSTFHAAKALESAAMTHKDAGDMGKAADLMDKASTMYLEHGTPDTAALTLDRAAKMLEQSLPERAIEFYLKACDVCEAEDRPHQCAEMVGKAARLLIRTKRLEEAAVAVQREINYYGQVENPGPLNKLVMGLVLIQLTRGDYVAADQAYRGSLHFPGFAASDEAGPIERLLDAYDQGDQQATDQITKSPLFRFMENDFTKLARDLQVPIQEEPRQRDPDPVAQQEESTPDDPYAEGLL